MHNNVFKKLFLLLVFGFMANVALAVPVTMDVGDPFVGNPGYIYGFGYGRGIGFRADENFSVSTYAIDLSVPLAEAGPDYVIELYSSTDGQTVGALLATSATFKLIQVDGYQDVPFSYDFIAGNYYILNYSRVDNAYSGVSARFNEEDHLPYDYGVLTLIEGFANAYPDPTNVALVHARFDGTPEVFTFSVGGFVNGLTGAGLELQNNGVDTLAIAADGPFTFLTELADTTAYTVTVSAQPIGQTCSVTNDSGVIASAHVTDVFVNCVDDDIPTYSVGGDVSGLTGAGLELQNNGVDTLAIAADGPFTFLTELIDTTAYTVTVSAQPIGQTCSVTNDSGVIAAADVTNVVVTCADDIVVIPTYSVGGDVSGLTGAGLELQNNGVDTLAIAADGPFTFLTDLADTTAYTVTVSAQPIGQTCSVTNESGVIAAADVTNVAVDCFDDVSDDPALTIPVTPVPTLSQWALITLSILFGLMVFTNRKRLF